jgi:hypothetical protein
MHAAGVLTCPHYRGDVVSLASRLATPMGAKATAVIGTWKPTRPSSSAKGSNRLVGRALRKRGGWAKKKGLSTDEDDCVQIVRDRSSATIDQVLPDLQARTGKR